MIFHVFQLIKKIMQRQEKRQATYTEFCNSDHEYVRSQQKVLKFTPPKGMFPVTNFQLLYSKVPKVGCTNWYRVLIYLATDKKMSYEQIMNMTGSEIHGHYRNRILGPSLNSQKVYKSTDAEYILKHYFKFIFVRHPLDRLLSAYNSKFNTTLWFRRIYLKSYGEYIIKQFSQRQVNGTPDYVTFEEFLRYAANAPSKWLNSHWSPYFEQFSFCNPTWRYDFIGHYETMNEDANYLLDIWNVTDIRFPSAYREKEAAFIRFRNAFANIPTDLVDDIWKRYFPDFALFGYTKLP